MLNKNKSNSLKVYLKENFSKQKTINLRVGKEDSTFRVYLPQLLSFIKKISSKTEFN